MSQHPTGTPGAQPKMKGGAEYRIERRTKKKGTDDDLSGFAIDITIRANHQGAYFLQDHNSQRNVMPHGTLADLIDTVVHQLVLNDREHFGRP